jgi:hypothetical protein
MDNIYLLVDQISDRVSKQALSDKLVKERCEYYSNSAKLDSFGNEYAKRLEEYRSWSNRLDLLCMGVITVPDCPELVIKLQILPGKYPYDFKGSDYEDSKKYLSEGVICSPLDVEGHRKLFLSKIKDILLDPSAYDDGIPSAGSLANRPRDIIYKVDNGEYKLYSKVTWEIRYQGQFSCYCHSIIKDHV